VSDPNYFGGPLYLRRFREETWSEMPLYGDYEAWRGAGFNWRGLGVADMADAIVQGRPHRASGELAYHVLDTMCGIHDASTSGKYYEVKSICGRPEPLIWK
jgi:hypothetical protein